MVSNYNMIYYWEKGLLQVIDKIYNRWLFGDWPSYFNDSKSHIDHLELYFF